MSITNSIKKKIVPRNVPNSTSLVCNFGFNTQQSLCYHPTLTFCWFGFQSLISRTGDLCTFTHKGLISLFLQLSGSRQDLIPSYSLGSNKVSIYFPSALNLFPIHLPVSQISHASFAGQNFSYSSIHVKFTGMCLEVISFHLPGRIQFNRPS